MIAATSAAIVAAAPRPTDAATGAPSLHAKRVASSPGPTTRYASTTPARTSSAVPARTTHRATDDNREPADNSTAAPFTPLGRPSANPADRAAIRRSASGGEVVG
jgi:hypothetical protein